MANGTLDAFCGSEFWNRNITWDTDDPDFTKCFEKTVLAWAPCAFLWTFAALELYYIRTSKKRDIPWNVINVGKLFFTAALVLIQVVDLVQSARDSAQVPRVDITTPLVKLWTFILSAVLVVYNRKRGLQSSALLFLFWLLLALFGAFQFRTEIRGHVASDESTPPIEYYQYVSYLTYYPLVIVMFLFNCFADKAPRQSPIAKHEKPCPEQSASFLSRLLFTWFDSLTWLGFRKPLEEKDLWNLNPEDSSSEVVQHFESHWSRVLEKCASANSSQTRASYKPNSASVDFVNSSSNVAKKKQASILPAMCRTFGPMFIFGALLKLIQDLLTFVGPEILGFLITHVKTGDHTWKGYFYACVLFGTATVQTLILSQYFNRMFILGMRIRTALVGTIYRKALKISNAARKETTVGEIVNLMAVDAQKFVEFTAYINMIWSAPLQIALSLYFLWRELGPSVLAGLAVMIILIPINGVIANKIKQMQIKQMKNKDERVRLMNEILGGIKVLKLYAWEKSFEEQVLKIRRKEIAVLKQAAYLNAGTSFIWSCAPFLVSLVTFATYVLVDEKNVLDANKAYVSIALFNILRFPLSMLPNMISNLVQTYVSVQRINKFMNAEELNSNNVTHIKNEVEPITIENATFTWGEEEPILKNINVRMRSKTLTAVVGPVGCGKSSLISALLGEMDKVGGTCNTHGSIAYVSQQAWIQNATLRENILFGKPYDERLYKQVIAACALEPDFAMLPAGDSTEIGEKGINLSGGQKQRVSLARAVYSDCDLLFLDDPLSAVDSHVGKHIFDQVIGPKGLLKNKTRILVTHGVGFLPQTDQILVIKDGEVSESGSYRELLDRKGDFADFLVQHALQEGDQDVSGDDVVTDLPEDLKHQVLRQRSHISESGSNRENSLKRQTSVDSTRSNGSSRSREAPDEKEGERLIEEEKSQTGRVSWAVYKYYLGSIGFFLTFTTIVLNLVFQGFSIGSTVWLGFWADDKNSSIDTSKRDMYLGVYGALGIGQAVALISGEMMYAKGACRAAVIIHTYLCNRVLRLPMRFFDTTPLGRVLARFSNDINSVDQRLPAVFHMIYMNVIKVLGTLVVISYTTPLFIAVILPIGIFYYFIQRFYVATSRQLKRLESVSKSPIYSHFGETITGAQAIRAFKQQDRFILESERKVDQNLVCYYPSIISNRWLAVRLEMLANLIIFFAAMFAVLAKNQMPALVGLSVTYALQITQTLNWLVRMTSDVETNIVAVERIKEYGEAPQEAAWEIPNKNPSKAWPESGAVEFRDYAVRYRPGLDLVLKKCNFSVRGGEKIGIVGRTGAGKSSLTLALFRIIEAAEGDIYIDGVKIADLGLHTLRSRLTIIPQDPVLFSGSLRMNLDPFDTYSDEDIWRALEHAHLKSFVKGLGSGIQHQVTEGGENLSVGQRQLICLARALLRKTKILILDEATAAVDLETDDLIQKTIRTEFKECTVLTIAHRLNTILDSDRVLVLDKGKIAEFETPQVLMADQRTIFYGMCKDAGLI